MCKAADTPYVSRYAHDTDTRKWGRWIGGNSASLGGVGVVLFARPWTALRIIVAGFRAFLEATQQRMQDRK